MARSKAFPLLLLLGLVSLASSPATVASEFDFFYLTLVWPGGYCNSSLVSRCCRPTTGKPAQDFLVQAFETYSSTTGEPVTLCNTTECRFSTNALWDLIEDLYAYWSNISCPSNNGRQQWEDVWCTYGNCSNLNETYFFERALDLRAQADLLSILQSNGIEPSSSDSYKLEDIQGALDSGLGSSSTVVECSQELLSGDYQLLYKIHICVSSDALSIISCPIEKSSNCGSEVKFLPFDPNDLHFGSANNMAKLIKMPAAIDVDM